METFKTVLPFSFPVLLLENRNGVCFLWQIRISSCNRVAAIRDEKYLWVHPLCPFGQLQSPGVGLQVPRPQALQKQP